MLVGANALRARLQVDVIVESPASHLDKDRPIVGAGGEARQSLPGTKIVPARDRLFDVHV